MITSYIIKYFLSVEKSQMPVNDFSDVSPLLFFLQHVGWWSPTIIRGEDREAIHIPNHKFTMNVVRNLTQKTHWRIKTHLAISHLDVNKINVRTYLIIWQTFPFSIVVLKIYMSCYSLQSIVADMRKVLAKNPQVEQQRLHRRIFLENVDPENQSLLVGLIPFNLYS